MGMLRSVDTPGASSAAAICLVPAFFDAPEISTRPWSGPLGRTRKVVMIPCSARGVVRRTP